MRTKISEKQIEERLRTSVAGLGGKAYKFVSPGNDGVPDRLVVMPGGRVYFVELKCTGEKPTKLQEMRIRELRERDCTVFVIDSYDGVDTFIRCLENGIL